jgi:PleD family two-component response regulator
VEEEGNHSVEYVFNCADELLYKAKANGKNEISTRFNFSKP